MFNIAPISGVWDRTGTQGTWGAYTEYMFTILEMANFAEKHCGTC